MYHCVGYNLFHDKLISQFLMTGHTASPYRSSGGRMEKNLSPAYYLISQIPSLWNINSLTLLGSTCVDAQACTLASHTSEARAGIAAPLHTRQVCGYRETYELENLCILWLALKGFLPHGNEVPVSTRGVTKSQNILLLTIKRNFILLNSSKSMSNPMHVHECPYNHLGFISIIAGKLVKLINSGKNG